MRANIAMTCACCAALLIDCTATETGNPVAEQHMSLTARSSDDDITLRMRADAPRTYVKQAWIVVGDVRFVQEKKCETPPKEADIPGPVTIELVWKPKALDFAVEDTDYCRVVFPLRRAKAPLGDAPPELEDHSIFIKGERADMTPFQIRSRITSEADIRAPKNKPFRVKDATSALIIGFDLGMWLKDIDLDALEPNADGTILIDEDHEQDSLALFEDRVNQAMELFRDKDDDGSLDASEEKAPLASGMP
jgi:hypothetical protein